MKNTFACVTGKKLLTAIAFFFFVNLTEFNPANAQAVAKVTPIPTDEQPVQSLPTGLRANVHQVDGPLKFKVNYENPTGGFVEIRILDKEGLVLHKNLFPNTPRKVTAYDLSSLEDGIYTFEVSTLLEKYSKSFAIQTKPIRAVTPVKDDQTDDQLTLYKLRQSDNP